MNKSPFGRLFCAALALSLAAMLTASHGQGLPTPTTIQLKDLQGYWEGDGAGGKCSITITNDTLVYRVGTNWHKATFVLTPGTNPQQLHATIKDSWPPMKDAIDQVIPALIKIEDGTLTLAAYSLGQETPKTFEEVMDKYVVKKATKKGVCKPDKTTPPKTNESSLQPFFKPYELPLPR